MQWLVFTYMLPADQGSTHRVKIWRRLKRLGAISPVTGINILPDTADTLEAFQWLTQETRQGGADAYLMQVQHIDGLDDAALVEAFRAERANDYAELAVELDTLAADDTGDRISALRKLRKKHADIARIDYFHTQEGTQLAARIAALENEIAPRDQFSVETVDLSAYRDVRWATRPRPHVDRLACAWLIRRTINPEAEIVYTDDPAPDDVTFDMPDADFGHNGSQCSFETMCRAFGLSDPAVLALAEIIHDIDLQDNAFGRPEAVGIDAILRGWLADDLPDVELEARGFQLFDGLKRYLEAQEIHHGTTDT